MAVAGRRHLPHSGLEVVTPQEEWERQGVSGFTAIVAEGEARERRIRQLCDTVRGHLEEQCFWAYPPPYVDEDARPKRETYEGESGAAVLWGVLHGYLGDTRLNASYELYRRYKYGPEERLHYRNQARRAAASKMVEVYLLLKLGA